jgi:DNA-directed RNA polymerase specialized sigma24 family protein
MPEYVSRQEFYDLLIEYKKTKSRKTYNQIGTIFLKIARNYLNKCSFINYSEDRKQDMVSDAVYYMCRFIDRYDPTKLNPFAYFTTFAKNAFLQYLNERKKIDKMFTSIEYIENFNDIDSLSSDME